MDYEQRLGAYLDRAFAGAEPTAQVDEAKAELLADLVDKHRTLVAQGQSPQGAYEITIAGVGDIFEVVDQVSGGSWRPSSTPDAPWPVMPPPRPQPWRLLSGGLGASWYPVFVIACWAAALVACLYVATTPHLRPYLLLIPVIAVAVHGLVHSVTAYSEAESNV